MKQSFQNHLERRFSLRLHMLAILLATALSGVLFAKMLFVLRVVDFRVRYPLSVLLSYLVFFVCIKLWLFCIASAKKETTSSTAWFDVPSPSFRGSGGGNVPPLRGGGGQFSGAGASGSFKGPDMALVENAALATPQPAPGGGASDGIGGVVGEAVGSLGDDNIIVAVIVLLVLVVTILISTVFLLYGAPHILSEAAFDGLLAASLVRGTRVISGQTWVGSILMSTWMPFAVTVGVAFFAGWALHSYYPEAIKLTDILWKG
jgi:hypothetical protein